METFDFIGLVSAIIVLIGLPFYLGWVRQNPYFGLGGKKFEGSRKLWFELNKRFGRNCVLTGLSLVTFAFYAYFFSPLFLIKKNVEILMSVMLMVMLLTTILDCFFYFKKLKKTKN